MPDPAPSPADHDPASGGADVVAIVAAALERIEREGVPAIDTICSQHPLQAPALRKRLAFLLGTGLFDAPGTNAAWRAEALEHALDAVERFATRAGAGLDATTSGADALRSPLLEGARQCLEVIAGDTTGWPALRVQQRLAFVHAWRHDPHAVDRIATRALPRLDGAAPTRLLRCELLALHAAALGTLGHARTSHAAQQAADDALARLRPEDGDVALLCLAWEDLATHRDLAAEPAAAVRAWHQALTLAHRLGRLPPHRPSGDPRVLRDGLRLAQAQARAGDPAAAERGLRDLLDGIASPDPRAAPGHTAAVATLRATRHRLGQCYLELADLRLAAGAAAAATAALATGHALLATLHRDAPGQPTWSLDLADAHVARARQALHRDDAVAAHESLDAALAVLPGAADLPPVPEPDAGAAVGGLLAIAELAACLGRPGEQEAPLRCARACLNRLPPRAQAGAAVTALRARVAALRGAAGR